MSLATEASATDFRSERCAGKVERQLPVSRKLGLRCDLNLIALAKLLSIPSLLYFPALAAKNSLLTGRLKTRHRSLQKE